MNDTIHHTLMATYMTFHKQVSLKILKEKLQPGQPKVLEFLKENDGSEQKEIARECCLDPATVTGILGRMERSELIERRKKEGNRRSLYTFLTPKGLEGAEVVEEIFKSVEEKALKGISISEQHELLRVLKKIRENLSEEVAVKDGNKKQDRKNGIFKTL